MKKRFKGLAIAFLALGFLAGCGGGTYHTVEFYEDNVGKFYKEVKVKHGDKVAKPDDPTARENYDFEGWWVDEAYSAEFNFDKPIEEDTSVYGKWKFNPPYVPDERTFHIVGALNNTDLSYINWADSGEEGVDWDTRSYLTKAEDSNIYSIELEIGYLGKFKVKIPGRPWDSDQEFNWTHIKEEDRNADLQEGDLNNIQIINAGLYKIEIDSTFLWAKATRLGDATGEGVRPNPAEGEVADWGLSGTINNWGNPEEGQEEGKKDFSMHYDEGGDFYYYHAIHLPEGAEFKLRADNAWSEVFGPRAVNELPDTIIQPTTEVEGETVIDEAANLKVAEGGAGYYTVFFNKTKLVMKHLGFSLRGDAVGGWGEDSNPLDMVGTPEEVEGGIQFTFEKTVAVETGQLKVKLNAIDDYDGWNVAFGAGDDGADNFEVEAGNVKITLVVVLNVETDAFTGTATVVAA